MLSGVGNDARGDEALSILNRFHVDTSLIQRIDNAPTGSVGISFTDPTKPIFEIHANSAWDKIGWTSELKARLADVDAIYFGTLGQRGEQSRATIQQAIQLAKSRGVLRVLDVNLRKPFFDADLLRDSIAQSSVLKLSDEELSKVAAACDVANDAAPEIVLRKLLSQFKLDLVVMTRGAQGAILVSPTELIQQPGIPAVVRDTVGAGDAFTAALVVGLLRGDALTTIARNACETASAVCEHDGAVPQVE
jgi:fructokinase